MALTDVVFDSTDPATMRPDLALIIAVGSRFIPMKLPDFSPKICLPSHVKPDNAWGLFELFLPKDQLAIIVKHTNSYVDHLDLFKLDENSPKKRLCRWKPMIIEEAYIYFGIRIYISIYIKNKIEVY